MLEDITSNSGPFEFIFGFIVLFSIMFYAFTIKSRMIRKGKKEYYFFVRGLTLKLVGGFLFGIVYVFYYGYGDTHVYFASAKEFSDFIKLNPKEGFYLYLENAKHLKEIAYATITGNYIYILPGGREMPFLYAPDFFLMSKLLVPILFISQNSYFVSTIIVALISFIGVWNFYKTLCKIAPNEWKNLGYACFYVPSIFFWGSGLMKDSFTIAAVGFIVSSFYSIFFEKKGRLLEWIVILCSSYVLLILKGYILFAILPALLLWLFSYKTKNSKTAFFRIFIMPALFIFIAIGGSLMITELSKSSDKYAIDNLANTAQSYQSWHASLAGDGGGGSSYSLGEVDFSTSGIIKKIPSALNVTFFRPYPWEVRSAIMAISSIESMFVLLFTFYLMYNIKLFPFFKLIFKNPEILMFFVFTIILGFAVGFTTYNFGALARYKIPCLLTYIIMLILIDAKRREAKALMEQ